MSFLHLIFAKFDLNQNPRGLSVYGPRGRKYLSVFTSPLLLNLPL